MIYRWIHVPRRIFTCSPMAELLSNIGFYSVEQRRIVDIIESQGSGDWLHASRWMKVAGTRWRLMGVNSRYDLLSSVSLSKRIYRLLRILPAWFYLVFNYPQGFRDKGVAAVVSQILISASGQISTPTVCSVETCSLESANYLFCRLDIKDAGHSEWCEPAFYASDLARVLQVQMSEFTFRLLLSMHVKEVAIDFPIDNLQRVENTTKVTSGERCKTLLFVRYWNQLTSQKEMETREESIEQD